MFLVLKYNSVWSKDTLPMNKALEEEDKKIQFFSIL